MNGCLIQNLGLNSVNITTKYSHTGGLVGSLSNGTVKNCYVTGTLNTSAGELAGLVGYADSGTINNCNFTGTLNTSTGELGGLVGNAVSCTISNCYFNGSVGAVPSSSFTNYIGGLVGHLENGSLTICNAKGSVTTSSTYSGGLIGYVEGSGQISDSYTDVVVSVVIKKSYAGGFIGGTYYFTGNIVRCYCLGSVTGTGKFIGGFIGEGWGDSGYITNCYSLTNVNGGDNAGGFYGYSYYLTTENCYAAGAVTGTSGLTGGFAGYDYGGNTITNSFWDVQTSGQPTSDGDLGVPKSTSKMKTQSTFTGCDFSKIWNIESGNSISYPYLRDNVQSPAPGHVTLVSLATEPAAQPTDLYFTITSSEPSPGTFILVLDFSSLGLAQNKWASFKIMKRSNSTAPWVDITSLGGSITNRCTDGVWGKFTVSGLSSFSDFAMGEEATVHIVTSAAESAATVGTLKYCIANAVVGDYISFNLTSMGTNTIKSTSPVVIDKDLTIQGAASGIVLDGKNVTKVLDIYAATDPQPVVRLEKLTITKGNNTGNVVGGIENMGNLTMVNCLVVDNSDTGYLDGAGAVGGISSSGNLTLINCNIAGIAGAPAGDVGLEGIGGIYCNGDLKIYNTIIYGNTGYYRSMASTRNIIESYNSLFEETYNFLTDTKGNNNFFFQGTPVVDNKFGSNPKFVGKSNNAANPYLILGISPCVDRGNDTYSFDDTDIRGGSFGRKLSKDDLAVKSPIDIGAYEWKKGTDPNNIFTWTGGAGKAWNAPANWDINDVPKPEDIVTVPDVPNKPEVASLSVATGGQLTIHANSSVTTTGAVDNNGTIIIRSDIDGTGSLITSESAKGSGQALIERYMVKNQWHIISSPTGTQTINNFLSDNIDIPVIGGKTPVEYGMMDYNPSTNDWNPYFTDATAGTLGIGKGYMVRVQDPVVQTLSGFYFFR